MWVFAWIFAADSAPVVLDPGAAVGIGVGVRSSSVEFPLVFGMVAAMPAAFVPGAAAPSRSNGKIKKPCARGSHRLFCRSAAIFGGSFDSFEIGDYCLLVYT